QSRCSGVPRCWRHSALIGVARATRRARRLPLALPRLARTPRVALAIVGGLDGDIAHKAAVGETRADALIHVQQQPIIGGDDSGHLEVVAIVDDLEELLRGPRGGVL